MLDDALRLHNDAHPDDRFLLLALNTAESSEVASSIHWIVPQGGDTSKVSANITGFMANHPKQGVSVFIGGRNFTQDMIAQTMRKRDAKFLVMENAEGATKEFADKLKDERKFSDAFTLVQRMAEALQELYPEKNIFREGVNPFDRASLQALEKKMIQEATPRSTVVGDERRLIPPAQQVDSPAAGK